MADAMSDEERAKRYIMWVGAEKSRVHSAYIDKLAAEFAAVRWMERGRWESIIELYDTALEGACTLAENSMHLDGFEEPMADIRNAARQDLQRARAAIREQNDD